MVIVHNKKFRLSANGMNTFDILITLADDGRYVWGDSFDETKIGEVRVEPGMIPHAFILLSDNIEADSQWLRDVGERAIYRICDTG